MAIPADIKEVIDLAAIQQAEETTLDTLKNKKIELQAQIAELNNQIANQIPIVQAARANLKSAATNL